jgi:long-chain acyl-CoA synthetase
VIHGLNETEVTHVITSHSLLPKLFELQKHIKNVKKIIYIDGFKSPSLEKFDSNEVTLISLSKLEEMGKCSTTELIEFAPSEEDIAVVLYTSGKNLRKIDNYLNFVPLLPLTFVPLLPLT